MTKQHTDSHCKNELRGASLRATPARIAVLRLLETTQVPVDITTVKKHLDRLQITTDPATVFRIMNMFMERGLVRQISFNEGKFRYELANIPDHHHLICAFCGKVEDFSNCNIPALEQDIKKKKGFKVKAHSLEFYGLCAICQNKEN